MSETTGPQTLDQALVKIKEIDGKIKALDGLVREYQDSTMALLNNGQLVQEVNRIDNSLTTSLKRQKKVLDIGDILLKDEEFFSNLPVKFHDIEAVNAKINQKMKSLHKENKDLKSTHEDINNRIQNNFDHLAQHDEFNENEPKRFQELRDSIEEHCKETAQKMIQTAILELENKLNEQNQKKFDEIEEEMKNIESRANEKIQILTDRLEKAEQRIEEAKNEAIQQAAEDVQDARDTIQEHGNHLEQIDTTISEMHAKDSELEKVINENHDNLTHQIEDINKGINDINNHITNHETENSNDFADVRNEIQTLKNQDQSLDEKYTNEVSRIDQTIKSLDEKHDNNLQSESKALNKRIDTTNADLTNYKTTTDDHLNQIDNLINEIHQTEHEMQDKHQLLEGAVNKKEENIRTEIAVLTSKNEKLTKIVSDCKNRNDEVYRHLTEIKGSETISMTELRKMTEKAQSLLAETKEEVKTGISETRKAMVEEIDAARKKNDSNVNELRERLKNAKEAMTKQFDLKRRELEDKFNEYSSSIIDNTDRINDTLKVYFEGSTEDDDKTYPFSKTLPELIKMINDSEEKNQKHGKALQKELDSFSSDLMQVFDKLQEKVDGTENQVLTKSKEFDDFFEKITIKLKNEKNTNKENVKLQQQALEDAKKELQQQIEQATIKMNSNENEYKEISEELKKELTAINKAAENRVQDVLKELTTNYENTNKKNDLQFSEITKTLATLKGESGHTVDTLLSEIQKVDETLTSNIEKNKEATDATFEKVREDVDTKNAKCMEDIEKTANSVRSFKKATAERFDELDKKSQNSIINVQAEFQKSISETNAKFDNFIGANPNATLSNVYEKIDNDTKALNEKIDAIDHRIDDNETISNKNFESVSAKFKEIKEKQKAHQAAIDSLSEANNQFEQKINKNIDDQILTVQQQIDQANADNNDSFEAVRNSFGDVKQKLSDIKQDNRQKLKDLEDRSKASLQQQAESILNQLQQRDELLGQKIQIVNESLESLKGKDGISIPAIMQNIETVKEMFDQKITNAKNDSAAAIQDTQKFIKENRSALDERINQLSQDLTTAIDNSKKTVSNQQKANQEAIDKIGTSFDKKLVKVIKKIDDLNGGSEVNLKDFFDQFGKYRTETNQLTANNKTEIESLKKKLDEQPRKIKNELSNDFMTKLNSNKADNESTKQALKDFETRLRETATNKQVQELSDVINTLRDNDIRELKEKDASIEQVLTESIQTTRKEIEKSLSEHQDGIVSLREDLTKFNGGSGESLSQLAKRFDLLKKEHSATTKYVGQLEADLNSKITATQTKLNADTENFKKELVTTNQKITENYQTLNHDIDTNKKSFEKDNAQLRTLIGNLETSTAAQLENNKTELIAKISILETSQTSTFETLSQEIGKSKTGFIDLSKAFIDSTTKIKHNLSKISDKMKSERELTDKNLEIKANQVQNEFAVQIKSTASKLTDTQNNLNQKVTDQLNGLRADFESLRGESDLTIPMINAKIEKNEASIKEAEKETERNLQIQKDEVDAVLESYKTNMKQALIQLKQMIQEVKDRVTKTEQVKDENDNKIRLEFENDMNVLEKRINKTIDSASNEFNAKLVEINDKSKSDNSKIYEQFTNVNTQFSEIRAQFDNLKTTQMSNLKAYIAKIDQRVDERNQKAQDDVTAQVQKVEKKLKQNSEAFDQVCRDIETKLGESLDKTSKLHQKNQETFEALKGEVAEFQNEIVTQLQEKLDKFKGDIKKSNETIAQNKNDADKYYEKVSTDNEAMQNKLNEHKQVMFDEFDAIRKEINQVVKKMSNSMNEFIENQKQQIENDKENLANMHEESKQELIEINEGMNKQLFSEIETLKTDLNSRTESNQKDITDIKDKFNKTIAPKLNSLIDEINETNDRFEKFENTTGQKVVIMMKRYEDEKSSKDSVTQFVKNNEERLDRFTSNLNKEFVQAKLSIDSVTAKTSQELTEMHNELETVKQDMRELSRIKRLNADCEKINMKFETALSNLQQFQRTIFNYVMPDHQNVSCQNSRYPFSKSKMESSFKPSQRDRYDITDLNADDDLGLILRKAFQDHSYVVITIPKNATFKWNESVQLSPNQALEIRGEKRTTSQPSIIIGGYSKLNNDLFDLSRVVIDGFGSLKLRNLRIQANLNLPFPLRSSVSIKDSYNRMKYSECLDLSALFVSRCWDSSGPATIDIDSCMFDIDTPIINIGANSFCNIRISNSDITAKKSKSDSKVIYPITCENGGYKQGYGNVTLANVNITKPKLQWLDTPYLNQPDLQQD